MTILPLFPDGKDRCLTFSYDDGQIFDRRLVEIFNRHGMKATFNLNTEENPDIPLVPVSEYESLYLSHGHEIACHTFSHPFMERMPVEAMLSQIMENRQTLEQIANAPVKGMAYPFGTWSKQEQALLQSAGIVYSRTVNATCDFHLPENWMEWHPTCHHNHPELMNLAERFLSHRWPEGLVFYVWGHSFNFDMENNWDVIERFCEKMQDKNNVWYATNMQIYNYMQAYRSLQFSADSGFVFNPSASSVWIRKNGNDFMLPSGKISSLK